MSLFNSFVLKVHRGETPFFRFLHVIAKSILSFCPPRIPRFLKPLVRLFYEFHYFVINAWRWLIHNFYANPLFQSRCTTVGRNLRLGAIPYVSGHLDIHIGDDVQFNGQVDILCGRFLDHPRLIVGNRCTVGGNTLITANQEVILEDDVIVSYDCRISDSDGHPRQADLRAQKAPLHPRDIRPVRIGRYAWIGNGSHVMKGVTIGEGAIIGANSVVISDIPPYCLALGNPAEVYFRNVGKKKSQPAQRTSVAPQE